MHCQWISLTHKHSTSIYHKHCKCLATKQYYTFKHEISPGLSTSEETRSFFDWKNYRPVSNLSYISKVIEWAVCNQLTRYVETTSILEECQSTYRDGHSTETALLKVKTDFLNIIDDKEAMCLLLLDLTVAFDMITHDILLNRLKHHFGVTGKVLDWIRPYITQWEQSVVIGDEKSPPINLKQDAPQGSVLRPVLFTLYMSPLGDLCQAHGFDISWLCWWFSEVSLLPNISKRL